MELHSPDSVHACVLRAADSAEASAWFNTLHSALTTLTERALKIAAIALSNILGELKHIGWLSRKPPCEVRNILFFFYRTIIQNILQFIFILRMGDQVLKVVKKQIGGNLYLLR